MKYLRYFKFSDETVKNPNWYPYNVLRNKTSEVLLFDTVTLLYGDNGSGKSTFLNLLASKSGMAGAEQSKSKFFDQYLTECILSFDEDDEGKSFQSLPKTSRYIKSEDILYEIKKIQQEAVLQEGYLYHRRKLGMTREQAEVFKVSTEMWKQMERQKFAQEKYSNGETALQVFEDYLQPEAVYLLDEPEVSLSPEKQLELAELINSCARLLGIQFVIASHSPLLLGSIEGTIYDFNQSQLIARKWTELPNVKVYIEFFKEKGLF